MTERRNRGTSAVVSYVYALVITSVLVSSLLMAGSGLVEDERREVVRSELEVLGQSLAADVEGADRLAGTEGTEAVAVRTALPRRVGGVNYAVAVNQTGNGRVRLETTDPDVTVIVPVVTDAPLSSTTVRGGDVVVEYDGTVLEVRNP